MNYQELYSGLIKKYFGRSPNEKDKIDDTEIAQIEIKLGIHIPTSLKEYYLICGRLNSLNQAHNRLFEPNKLEIEDGYLIFLDENQSVVSWGFPIEKLEEENPIVWQRNNTPPEEWYSEEKNFPDFLENMLEWYVEAELIEKI